jgi:hypothetical protein
MCDRVCTILDQLPFRLDRVFSRYRLVQWVRFLLGCFVAGAAPRNDGSSGAEA